MKELVTDRLKLRHTTLADAAFLVELYNTPKWIQNIGDRNIHTTESAASYITDNLRPQLDRLGYGNYVISHQEKRVGVCGLYDREGLAGIDLGFALLPDYEGFGYAYEASLALIDMAWKIYGLSSLSAITLSTNTSSVSLLTKLGFSFLEHIRLSEDGDEVMHYILKHPGVEELSGG